MAVILPLGRFPMGPIIILDKSAIQTLSAEEAGFLHRHYYINAVPVLIIEVLGNLKKHVDDPERSSKTVRQYTARLKPIDSQVNTNHRMLVLGSLLGQTVPMTGQVIVSGAIPFVDREGNR